ncbi:MAG: hypothetical protein Q4C46_06510 [Bacillota bacterium]|nr:hypothetical protein [Bacillota bacterium]
MTIIIKDDKGNVVMEQEMQDMTCTVKVSENTDGEKRYSIEKNACSYH